MRRRLNALVAASTALVALAFVVPLGLLVRQLAEDRAIRPAELATRTLAPAVSLLDDPTRLDALVQAASSGLDGPLGVVLPDGDMLGAEPPVGILDQIGRVPRADRYGTPDGELVVVPVVAADGVGMVHALVTEAALRRGVSQAWLILGGLSVLLVGAATALADVLARRTLSAVREVERLARRLAAGDLGARAPLEDPPEIARVASVLGNLADRVERLLEAEREAAADLSHRLRTPLTPLRIDVEALPASAQRERLLVDVRTLEDQVSRVIRSFRSRATDEKAGRCLVATVVSERVDFWRPLAEDQERVLTLRFGDGIERAMAPLSAEQLGEAVDALLGNVFAHTPEGVWVTVSVERDADAAVVTVLDGGPGFPDGIDVRARGASGSDRTTGLGLDIARRAAESAGGGLALGHGADGGACATLRLPLGG